MTGWVYFAHLAGHSPIKIGHAFDVHSRLRALSVGSPFKLVMLGAYLSANAKADEKRLKTKLAAHRIKGEWFQADAASPAEVGLPRQGADSRRG